MKMVTHLASRFLVNSSKDGKQYHPTLVKNGNEGFFASWLTNDNNGNYIYSLQNLIQLEIKLVMNLKLILKYQLMVFQIQHY